jgi:hypothetical protein
VWHPGPRSRDRRLGGLHQPRRTQLALTGARAFLGARRVNP